jgi:hypothetical protein
MLTNKYNCVYETKMTRKKDKIKQRQDSIRKTENLHKSRVFQKQLEISQETNLLKNISNLPTELIRIIYGYMSGNGKLICNYKYDYIEKNLYSSSIDIIEKLSKPEILDFIYKGILRKYPTDIMEYIEYSHYSLELDDFVNVNGHNLLDLWQTNRLDYDFDENEYISYDENTDKDLKILNNIKHDIKHEIYSYLRYILCAYHRNKLKALSQKNWIQTGNTLFLKLDKAFHLFKCLENLCNLKQFE